MKRLFTMLVLMLALAAPAAPVVFAQDNANSGSKQTTTTQTKTDTPVTTTRTTETSRTFGVDPIWLVVGGIALLAILAIALLSMRGRGRDTVDTVREKTTTVIKE